ncbi:hypothetical protein LCGC14_0820640 [marine sediment metagenome]|uniref:Uncharacterized protein n=1 Tax=marine sediment metagenome TaxID=412755 RepID=A0A0F9PJ04_9ZZZZ
MRDRAELQAWMREGCPVAEVPAPEHKPCGDTVGFLLEAWPDGACLTTYCAGCGRRAGVMDGDLHLGRRAQPWPMLRPLCDWMDGHAGHHPGTAWETLAMDAQHSASVELWGDRLLTGEPKAFENYAPPALKIEASKGEHVYTLNLLPSHGKSGHGAEPLWLPMVSA